MIRPFIVAALLSLSLSGCGGGGAKVQAGPAAPTGVYTSATDCAESEKLSLSDCSVLIDQAVDMHHQAAKKYISMRLCEAAEGADHCERTEDNQYRPQLQAFLITFSNPPQAEPLYASSDKSQPGFQTNNKGRMLLAVDETLLFSKNARFVAASNGE